MRNECPRGGRLRGSGGCERGASARLPWMRQRANDLPPNAGTSDDDPCREGFVRSPGAGFLGTHPSAEMPAAPGIGEDKGWGWLVEDNAPPSESASANERTNSVPIPPRRDREIGRSGSSWFVRSSVSAPMTVTCVSSGRLQGNQHSPGRPPSPPSPAGCGVGPSASPAPLPRPDHRGHCSVLIGLGTAQPRNTKRRLRNGNDATLSGLAR
jgi:hypothetical protein